MVLKTEVYECSVCLNYGETDRSCLCIVPLTKPIPDNCLYDTCDYLPEWKKLGDGNFA